MPDHTTIEPCTYQLFRWFFVACLVLSMILTLSFGAVQAAETADPTTETSEKHNISNGNEGQPVINIGIGVAIAANLALSVILFIRLRKDENDLYYYSKCCDQLRTKNGARPNTDFGRVDWRGRPLDYDGKTEMQALVQRIATLERKLDVNADILESMKNPAKNSSPAANITYDKQKQSLQFTSAESDLVKIFNQYSQFSDEAIMQIQKRYAFSSMRIANNMNGAIKKVELSDSNSKDARYLRPDLPFANGQYYVIPNPANRQYSALDLDALTSIFDAPQEKYTDTRYIRLERPAVISRNGQSFSLVQKGQVGLS